MASEVLLALNKPSRELLIDLINMANGTAFTPTQLIFSNPTALPPESPRNTEVVVTPTAETIYSDSATISYNRMDLNVLLGTLNRKFTYSADYLRTSDLLALLNQRFGLALSVEDIVDEPLTAGSDFPKIATLTTTAGSLVYYGQLQLQLLRPESVSVTTAEDTAGYLLGWDPDDAGLVTDGEFVHSYASPASRSGEVLVGARARLGGDAAPQPSITVQPAESATLAGEDVYRLRMDPDLGNWFIDAGVRMGDYLPGSRLETLYDVTLRFYHTNPSAGALSYQLEHTAGAYQFRNTRTGHVLPSTYAYDPHLVSVLIDMQQLASTPEWGTQFGAAPKTAAGTPIMDPALYAGWYAFEITAAGKEDPDGRIFVGPDVKASFLIDARPANPWQDPIVMPLKNTFEEGLLLYGDWIRVTDWTPDGSTYSMRNKDINDYGESKMWCNVGEGDSLALRFDFKVDTEQYYDFLELRVDGILVWQMSGTVEGYVKYPTGYTLYPGLGPGAHLVEWIYRKDSSASSGLDSTWVDNIDFYVPTPTPELLPLKRGFLSFNDAECAVTVGLDVEQVLQMTDRPIIDTANACVGTALDDTEIVVMDTRSDQTTNVHFSWNGCLNWIKQTLTTHMLYSNSSAWFQGKLYVHARVMTGDMSYGVYRVERAGEGAAAVFSLIRVFDLGFTNVGDVIFAANDTHLVFFNPSGALRYTTDGDTFNSTTLYHPDAGIGSPLNNVAMDFVGNTLVGLGMDNSASSPPVISFSGIPGQTFAYGTCDPAGDSRNWTLGTARARATNDALIVACDTWTLRGTNAGANWQILLQDQGLRVDSLVDDGKRMMITGWRVSTTGYKKWMAYSEDRGVSFKYDGNVTGFHFSHADRLTSALGIKPKPSPVYFAYVLNNLHWGGPSDGDVTVGFGKVDANTGEYSFLGKDTVGDTQPSGIWPGSGVAVVGDGARLYVQLHNNTTADSGKIQIYSIVDGSLTAVTQYRRVLAGVDTTYTDLAFDHVNNLLWAIEYGQMSVSPYTVSSKLVALRWSEALQTLDVMGEYVLGSDARYFCVHNGFPVVYGHAGLGLLTAFGYSNGVVSLITTSPAISGYSSLSDDWGRAVSTDGQYIHLHTGNHTVRDTLFTFDGTTFTEVWRLSDTLTGSPRGTVAGGDVIVRKTTDGFDQVHLHLHSFDGAVSTYRHSEMRGTELMGMAYDKQHRLLLSPGYGGTNTSGAQNNLYSGVYKIQPDYSVVKLSEQFLLEETIPNTNNDMRAQIFFVPGPGQSDYYVNPTGDIMALNQSVDESNSVDPTGDQLPS